MARGCASSFEEHVFGKRSAAEYQEDNDSTLLTLMVIPAIYAVVKSVVLRLPHVAPSLQPSKQGGLQ
jgi:hypothetical protein